MSEPTPQPPQPEAGSDVTRSLAALADAMSSLAKSQQTVLDALRQPTQPKPTITGEFPGGSAPAAAVDFSKLTPLQQITLGLRDAPTSPTPPHGAD